MKVYLAFSEYPYEGQWIEGVYASEAEAKAQFFPDLTWQECVTGEFDNETRRWEAGDSSVVAEIAISQ